MACISRCRFNRSFRNTWILCRRRRPIAPSFIGAPLPRHRAGETNRAALITMTYFHPWTLRSADADEHVPYAGFLRESDETWERALSRWLDGNVICSEAARYVGNFLSINRVRPADDESEDGNSDDDVSDKELEMSNSMLVEALKSRIGGRNKRKRQDREADIDGHHENSSEGMRLAQEVWLPEKALAFK